MPYPTDNNDDDKKTLQRLKDNVDQARLYFDENYKRWHWFMRFIFETSLSDDDIDNLLDLQKPVLEFNILEAPISRLMGEFVKHEPSIEVEASHDTPTPIDISTVKTVDGICRAILKETKRKGDTGRIYRDLLGGGFGVFEVVTEYEHPKSFNQVFKLIRVPDPTMVGFDPCAQEIDKGDGEYCFKIYPRTYQQVKDQYPDAKVETLSYIKDLGGYSWSYKDQKSNKFILIAEYYEKKKVPITLYRLANGMVMTKKQYKQMLKVYEEKNILAVPPAIIEQRDDVEMTVCRTTFMENQILEYEETDFKRFPLFFADGNSVILREDIEGELYQVTRPAVYNARDTQRLKNFAGQTLANSLETMVQHKFKMAVEGMHPDYKSAYEDVQHANVLMYNAYVDNDPNKPVPPPQEITPVPAPPEVTNTFGLMDSAAQNIIGGFDLSMDKMDKAQLSGIAMQEVLTASNTTAMPIIGGYLLALTSALQFIVEMIPIYWPTPRTIPIIDEEGKRDYVRVNDKNDPQSVPLDYYDNALKVNVEAGLNFSLQKARTIQQVIMLMQASPLFAQFMNQKGLRVLIDNLEIRGIDQLKLMADMFMKELQQQQQAAMNQPNPAVMKMQLEQQKMQNQMQQAQIDNQLKAATIANDAQQNANDQARIMQNAEETRSNQAIQVAKANAETYSKSVELALEAVKVHHDHSHKSAQLKHQVYANLANMRNSANEKRV